MSIGAGEGHRPRSATRVKQLFVLGAAVFVLFTILSYALAWNWTGFTGNGTVWDWLSLFLLPIAVALIPSVFETSTKTVLTIFGALSVPLTVLLIGGYGFDWRWTGFAGNTLWDWLHLLLVPALIPIAVRTASEAQARRNEAAEGASGTRGTDQAPATPGRATQAEPAAQPSTLARLSTARRQSS